MTTFRNRSGKWQARIQVKGYTNLILAERNSKSVMFRYLTDIGNHCEMFYNERRHEGDPLRSLHSLT
jgi:hypothetical protein